MISAESDPIFGACGLGLRKGSEGPRCGHLYAVQGGFNGRCGL